MKYDKEILNRLKQISIENKIWIIYIGIIFLSWYSNSLERKYYIYKDSSSKEKYRRILIFIFSVLLIVYLYFLKSSINDLNNLKETDSKKKKELITLSFIASFLIAISGIIYLYIALNDNDLTVELAFN